MALLNKSTWQSKFADFINRVAPFNTNPLIQKSEHNTVVGQDLGESVIWRVGAEASINSPASTFTVNFDNADTFNIDTTGSVNTSFVIFTENLQSNETGVLKITKKSGDRFSFFSASLKSGFLSNQQAGFTQLVFTIRKIGSSYYVNELFLPRKNVIADVNTGTFDTIRTKVIEIGDWNMETTSVVSVSHDIVDGESKIRSVYAVIKPDPGSSILNPTSLIVGNPSNFFVEVTGPNGGITWTDFQINLSRNTSSVFDSTSYNQTSFNRGWITITYEE